MIVRILRAWVTRRPMPQPRNRILHRLSRALLRTYTPRWDANDWARREAAYRNVVQRETAP